MNATFFGYKRENGRIGVRNRVIERFGGVCVGLSTQDATVDLDDAIGVTQACLESAPARVADVRHDTVGIDLKARKWRRVISDGVLERQSRDDQGTDRE